MFHLLFVVTFRYWGFGHRYERNKLAIRLEGVTPRQHTFQEPEADARGGVAAVHKGVPSPYPLEEAAVRLMALCR